MKSQDSLFLEKLQPLSGLRGTRKASFRGSKFLCDGGGTKMDFRAIWQDRDVVYF